MECDGAPSPYTSGVSNNFPSFCVVETCANMSGVMRSATECQHVAVLSQKGKKKVTKMGKEHFFPLGLMNM